MCAYCGGRARERNAASDEPTVAKKHGPTGASVVDDTKIMGFPIGIGIVIGGSFAIGVGIAIGVVVGAAIGAALRASSKPPS